jgi:hypothetical protein
MVVFQGQHLIGSTIDDRLRDGFLTTHRISGYHRTVPVEPGQPIRNGGDLVNFCYCRKMHNDFAKSYFPLSLFIIRIIFNYNLIGVSR